MIELDTKYRMTKATVEAFVARAERVIQRKEQTGYTEIIQDQDGNTFSLPAMYMAIHDTFDMANFRRLALPPVESIIGNCEMDYANSLKEPELSEPLLVGPTGLILDGTHRAVRNIQMNRDWMFAYRLTIPMDRFLVKSIELTKIMPDGKTQTIKGVY